jgi:methyltransferase
MILGWPHILIVLVALQRLGELIYARKNTKALLARGAREVGASHYPLMVLLHAGWIVALFALTDANPPPQWLWLAIFAVCQALRLWVLFDLGPYWTTRIIVMDGAPAVRRGLYRYVRHPNYLIVAVEVPALPLGLGMPKTALVFGLLNLAILAWRVRVEDAARRGIN